jgi:hypothetical protein
MIKKIKNKFKHIITKLKLQNNKKIDVLGPLKKKAG